MSISMKQLFGLWGLTYKEIGSRLELSESTVYKRVSNGKGWKLHEINTILRLIESETGVTIKSSQLSIK